MPCHDCGCHDSEMPLDTVLTLKQWETICPESVDRDFVLCASCIVRRAAKLRGYIGVTLRLAFSDDLDGSLVPDGKLWGVDARLLFGKDFDAANCCGLSFVIMKRLDGLIWSNATQYWEPVQDAMVTLPCC